MGPQAHPWEGGRENHLQCSREARGLVSLWEWRVQVERVLIWGFSL